MKEIDYILRKIEENGLRVAGNPVLSENNEPKYKIFVVHDNHLHDKQKKIINDIKTENKFHSSISIISINEYAGEAIQILRKKLSDEFSETIENVIYDTYSSDKIIYINLKDDLTDEKEEEIKNKSKSILKMLHLKGYSISLINKNQRVSILEIARIVKILSPVTIENLSINLINKGYTQNILIDVPDKIKFLEEKKFILKDESERYVLTYLGIIALGSRKSKYNEDLMRVLAISRLIR